MILKRQLQPRVEAVLHQNLVAIVYGARQVGKTTLVLQIAEGYQQTVYLNCDDPVVVANLSDKSAQELKAYIGTVELVIIDEAQRVENIGLTLKLLHDTYPEIKLLVTGSSSLDLANKVSEPLTGRSVEFQLYPFSVNEVSADSPAITANTNILLDRGGYPGMWNLSSDQAHVRLVNLATNYIYRDAFSPQVVYDQTIINDLLRLLAYQVGNEVNYSELGSSLSISKETVMRYIDLLEKAFIVFRRTQYRRNQRSEVGRLRKIFFVDLGIRNAIIDTFKPLEFRDDVGALWENYCAIERLKYLQTTDRRVRSYYWRSSEGREIDIIEEEAGMLRAYECKYGPKTPKVPVGFNKAYPDHSYAVVNPQNFTQVLLA